MVLDPNNWYQSPLMGPMGQGPPEFQSVAAAQFLVPPGFSPTRMAVLDGGSPQSTGIHNVLSLYSHSYTPHFPPPQYYPPPPQLVPQFPQFHTQMGIMADSSHFVPQIHSPTPHTYTQFTSPPICPTIQRSFTTTTQTPESSLPPPHPPDSTQLRLKLQIHKEETSARFGELMTAFTVEQEEFRRELREELQQLRLSYSNPPTTTVSTSPLLSSSLIPGNPSSPNDCQLLEPNCKPQSQIPDPTPPASFTLTQAVANPTYTQIVIAPTPPQILPQIHHSPNVKPHKMKFKFGRVHQKARIQSLVTLKRIPSHLPRPLRTHRHSGKSRKEASSSSSKSRRRKKLDDFESDSYTESDDSDSLNSSPVRSSGKHKERSSSIKSSRRKDSDDESYGSRECDRKKKRSSRNVTKEQITENLARLQLQGLCNERLHKSLVVPVGNTVEKPSDDCDSLTRAPNLETCFLLPDQEINDGLMEDEEVCFTTSLASTRIELLNVKSEIVKPLLENASGKFKYVISERSYRNLFVKFDCQHKNQLHKLSNVNSEFHASMLFDKRSQLEGLFSERMIADAVVDWLLTVVYNFVLNVNSWWESEYLMDKLGGLMWNGYMEFEENGMNTGFEFVKLGGEKPNNALLNLLAGKFTKTEKKDHEISSLASSLLVKSQLSTMAMTSKSILLHGVILATVLEKMKIVRVLLLQLSEAYSKFMMSNIKSFKWCPGYVLQSGIGSWDSAVVSCKKYLGKSSFRNEILKDSSEVIGIVNLVWASFPKFPSEYELQRMWYCGKNIGLLKINWILHSRAAKNFKTMGNLLYSVLYAVFGITMITKSSFNKARKIIMVMSTAMHEVVCQLQDGDSVLALLKQNLHKAQDRMKLFYDKWHIERIFEIGDWVYLKLQVQKQHFVERRTVHKLFAKYHDPFEVIERFGIVAYKLRLPNLAKIHLVLHVSLLKKKVGSHAVINPHLPPVVDPRNPLWYPAKVLDTILVKRCGGAYAKWLVQWIGTPLEDATWEFADDIKARYSDFEG